MKQEIVTEKMKFFRKWVLSKEEIELKQKLINDLLTDLKTAYPFYETFFSDEKICEMIGLGLSSARLRPVTSKILLNYFTGLSKIPFAHQDSSKWAEIDSLIKPLIDLRIEFISSKEYRDHLIKQEITGDDSLKFNNLKIRISRDAIQLHIERIKAFPMVSKDIAPIETDFVEYKKRQFKRVPKNILNKSPEIKTDETPIPLHDPKFEVINTNANLIKTRLGEYGFFEMGIIKQLNQEKQDALLSKLADEDVPYQIAMLDYLGFIRNIGTGYTKANDQRDKILGTILGTGSRTIKGNINVLNSGSKEDRNRYTSHVYTLQVKEDFQSIKN